MGSALKAAVKVHHLQSRMHKRSGEMDNTHTLEVYFAAKNYAAKVLE